jgi:hypothetical protein
MKNSPASPPHQRPRKILHKPGRELVVDGIVLLVVGQVSGVLLAAYLPSWDGARSLAGVVTFIGLGFVLLGVYRLIRNRVIRSKTEIPRTVVVLPAPALVPTPPQSAPELSPTASHDELVATPRNGRRFSRSSIIMATAVSVLALMVLGASAVGAYEVGRAHAPNVSSTAPASQVSNSTADAQEIADLNQRLAKACKLLNTLEGAGGLFRFDEKVRALCDYPPGMEPR